jgi:hypothetical protein
MTNAEKQYFALLQSAIWNRTVAINGAIDWQAVMRLAEHHATVTLLCDLATKMPADQLPNAEMLGWMKNQMRSNLFFHIRLKQTLLQAVKLLRDNGIEPVLLKGFSLAQYYPNPNLRQFGDVDLFVGLEKFHAACAVLRSLPGSYNWGVVLDSGRHFNLEFGDYSLEIHRVSSEIEEQKENAIYMEIERQGLLIHSREVELEGARLRIPSKEFMAFFTFYHAWHHFLTTGIGWRQLCDLTLVLHTYHGQINTEQLHHDLESLHLIRPWQTFCYLIVHQLGLPEAEMPFYNAKMRRKASKLYDHIMKEGNFMRNRKFKNKRPKTFFLRKLHALGCIMLDFWRMVWIFPDLAFKELRNSIRQGVVKTNHEISTNGKKIHKKDVFFLVCKK